MAYVKTLWTNDTGNALNEMNLNKIEQGIFDAHAGLDTKIGLDAIVAAGDLLYGTGVGTVARLAKTQDGDALVLSGGLPTWGSVTAGLTKLWDSDDAGVTFPVASITTGVLPQTCRNLRIAISGRGDAAAGSTICAMRLNGDTGGNYDAGSITGQGTALSGSEAFSATSLAVVGRFAGAIAPAGAASAGEVFIPSYAGTVFHKVGFTSEAGRNNSGTGSISRDLRGFFWRSTAAITTLTVFLLAGSFVAGTRLAVWGEV